MPVFLNDLLTGINIWIQSINPQVLGRALFILVKILLILIAVKIINKLGSMILVRIFERQTKPPFKMEVRKANTLKALLVSILRYVLYFVALMMILGEFVNTASLLATAGIGGIAIGFGAQSLVRDVINGFFILFEDQYSVGDFVTIGDSTGTVEEIGLRTTKLRGFKGELIVIPNGQIIRVSNHTRGSALAVVDIPVSFDTDVVSIIRIMDKTASEYAKENLDIIEPPQVLGTTNILPSEVTIRLIAHTQPNKKWGVEIELEKRVKEALSKNGLTKNQEETDMLTQENQDGR